MNDNSEALHRVGRLFKIVTLARSQRRGQPLGRPELAEACGCDPRTIQRDLRLLAEAGFPLIYDYGGRAYVLPENGWTFPVASLTAEDALALALLRGLAGAPGLPQSAALQATLDKLVGSLPSALKDLMRDAGQVFQPGRPVRDYSRAPLSELIVAAREHQTVVVDYRSRSRADRAWRLVDPYAVAAREGQYWELHGWCHRNQAIRTFALDQIFGMRPTGTSFCLREAEWEAFAGAKGIIGGLRGGVAVAVDVLFLPPVAEYARNHQWPDGLTLTMLADGTARLSGEVQGVDGMIPELLRWRRFCRVEGGLQLRARMVEEVRAIVALYE